MSFYETIETMVSIISDQALKSFSLSVAGAVVSFAATEIVKSLIASRISKAATKRAEFEKAISSDDLATLGGYLHDQLGKVSVQEYTRSKSTANHVDKYIKRITDYVSIEKSIYADITAENEPIILHQMPSVKDIPSSLTDAYKEVLHGEVWNGLARMRRDIEVRLYAMYPPDLRDKRPAGVSGMVRYLASTQKFPNEAARLINQAVNPANRAVHGLDVSREDAEHALATTIKAYKILGWQ